MRAFGGAILKSRMDEISKKLDQDADRLIREGAERVAASARERVGANTQSGELQRSIMVEQNKEGQYNVVAPAQAIKGGSRTGAHYGIYVEYGTRHTPPRPFLVPAIEAERENIVQSFNQHLKTL